MPFQDLRKGKVRDPVELRWEQIAREIALNPLKHLFTSTWTMKAVPFLQHLLPSPTTEKAPSLTDQILFLFIFLPDAR